MSMSKFHLEVTKESALERGVVGFVYMAVGGVSLQYQSQSLCHESPRTISWLHSFPFCEKRIQNSRSRSQEKFHPREAQLVMGLP